MNIYRHRSMHGSGKSLVKKNILAKTIIGLTAIIIFFVCGVSIRKLQINLYYQEDLSIGFNSGISFVIGRFRSMLSSSQTNKMGRF
jgi:hypothetical protein